MRSRHGSRVTQLHHRRAGGCAPWRPSLTSGTRAACHATASPRRGRPYSPRTPRLAPGSQLRTGRSALFGGWDAHWASGGRSAVILRRLRLRPRVSDLVGVAVVAILAIGVLAALVWRPPRGRRRSHVDKVVDGARVRSVAKRTGQTADRGGVSRRQAGHSQSAPHVVPRSRTGRSRARRSRTTTSSTP